MANVLLDTNIISFSLKADSRRALYEPHVAGRRTCLSFMTVAEMYRWSIVRNWGVDRKQAMEREFQRHITIGYDNELAMQWAKVMSIKGRPIEVADAWIAATAMRYQMPLITHNRRHFEHIDGLVVVSEA